MFRKMDQRAERREDRNIKTIRKKSKRGDSKVESNDSPRIPDKGKTSDILGLPSGGFVERDAFSKFVLIMTLRVIMAETLWKVIPDSGTDM